jgi:hypothetical protein
VQAGVVAQQIIPLPPQGNVTHAPLWHSWPAAQGRLHPPQCALLVCVLVSHPLVTLPSQLPKFVVHAPSPHVPPAHAAVAFVGVGHAMRQTPQCATLVRVSVSHPLFTLPSQSAKPV